MKNKRKDKAKPTAASNYVKQMLALHRKLEAARVERKRKGRKL